MDRIIQTAFKVSSDIQQGLDDGTLIRYGGLVRNQSGQIVKNLVEVSPPKVNSAKNKYIALGAAIVISAVGAASLIVRVISVPKCVKNFKKAFKEYINAMQKGAVSEEAIAKVINSLEEISKYQNANKIHLTISIEKFNMLLDLVRDYTVKLAEANTVIMPNTNFEKEDGISKLQYYLNVQKKIFQMCA